MKAKFSGEFRCETKELSQCCKFHNCTHTNEPGCAILEALEELNKTIVVMIAEEVKGKGISYIWLWATEGGMAFYKKYGFHDLTVFKTMNYYDF